VKLTAMLFDFVKLTASEKIQNSVEMLFSFCENDAFCFCETDGTKT
jgi:hypothetical protein